MLEIEKSRFAAFALRLFCVLCAKKRSNNYIKDSAKIRKIHEKATNKKTDLVKKTVCQHKKHEMIAMQADCGSGGQAWCGTAKRYRKAGGGS